MADLKDIANETIRDEITEFVERENEQEKMIDLFAAVSPQMQDIAAAQHHVA